MDNQFANTKLTIHNSEAKNAFINVFSKFSFFIRDVSSSAQSLEVELEKIDAYLKSNNYKFLCGNQLSKLDCSLLPRLQHIRVASEYIKNYKIPPKFKFLWNYMKNAYMTDEFQKSCPPDREIICHWSKLNTKVLLHFINDSPNKTLTVPSDINID